MLHRGTGRRQRTCRWLDSANALVQLALGFVARALRLTVRPERLPVEVQRRKEDDDSDG